MKIIRGELTPAALIPPTTRYDATCNCIQVTPDGGTTWVEAVGTDPRSQPAYLKPPIAGSTKRCDAAANMVAWLKSIIDEVIAALTAGATALLLANGLLKFIEGIFPFAAYFIELMFEFAVDVIGTGAIDINAAFDSTTYDQLLCIFYCHADANGQLDNAAYAAIGADIVSILNATAATIVSEILFITGFVGLSNAGAGGSETGDCAACTSCGWSVVHNFGEQSWSYIEQGTCPQGYSGGTWHATAGCGDIGGARRVWIEIPISMPAGSEILSFQYHYVQSDSSAGFANNFTHNGAFAFAMSGRSSGNNIGSQDLTITASGNYGVLMDMPGGTSLDLLEFIWSGTGDIPTFG